ncbi:MAG: nucleotide exchange factor GrpE [Clostridia bacterium]|nr:nucleotide exchange factor GrpE [Clostridia bacterium]
MAENKKKNAAQTEKDNKVENAESNKVEGAVKEEMTQEEYIEFLEGELGKNIAIADECKSSAQRLRADFENYKKRNASLSIESKQQGEALVLEELLPALDSCARAKTMITDKSALEGFVLLEQQLFEVLEKFDVKEIDAIGKDFDAKFMNAVLREVNAEMEGKVIEVFTKGYMIGGKVLRYAVVKVGC